MILAASSIGWGGVASFGLGVFACIIFIALRNGVVSLVRGRWDKEPREPRERGRK